MPMITQQLRNTLTFILAGGKGERLKPLTADRAKPSVPFGGAYRIIDFTLSNCVKSRSTRFSRGWTNVSRRSSSVDLVWIIARSLRRLKKSVPRWA